jgi:hypothetical protein
MMRALTLHRPWAWAIAAGHKRVENRTWRPPSFILRQRIAIHAGKTFDEEGLDQICSLLGCCEETAMHAVEIVPGHQSACFAGEQQEKRGLK